MIYKKIIVCFNPTQEEELARFQKLKQPFQLSNIKIKRNLFTYSSEVQIRKKSKVSDAKVDFLYQDMVVKVPIKSVTEKIGKVLSVEGYVNLEIAIE